MKLKRNGQFLKCMLIMLTLIYSDFSHNQELTDQVDECIRNRIENGGIPLSIIIGNEIIYTQAMLPLFYEQRAYRPARSDDRGPLTLVDDLIESIQQAHYEGLKPKDYHIEKITAIFSEIRQFQQSRKTVSFDRLVDLDLLCTDAFLVYSSHLLSGRVDPETFDPQWVPSRRGLNLVPFLEKTLEQKSIQKNLESLLPPQKGYQRLKSALAQYLQILENGGWPTVPDGPALKKGDTDNRIQMLCTRLNITNDLQNDPHNISQIYDKTIETAVKRFQKRHGLEETGELDAVTLVELNISIEKRIDQIKLNMERWKWLPQDLGKKHLLINIANFELDVVDNEKTIMTMHAVVGKPYRRTPVFSDRITYLVLNPYWNVPHNIAVQDLLPMIQKDDQYLNQRNIKVFRGWESDAVEFDPSTIDWSTLSSDQFPYRFRQEPGPLNALGQIKFMFPNKFNVYLHDTPSRELFAKTERTFSSGCIRIENPIELAVYFLQDRTDWTREKILMAIQKNSEQTISLPEPVPIHLLYWTAWVEENGSIQFRKDIYDRDPMLEEALNEMPVRSFLF
ncbi:L,D-transpeptidase family protein [bacterium]|nr:L,D-transpeptidase family protein [bacterium]RQV96331.1 MAG: peptidoglycan-binding protein [bacterium]